VTALAAPAVIEVRRRPRAGRAMLGNAKVRAGLAIGGFFIAVIAAQPILHATLWARKASIYHPLYGYDTTVVHPSAPSLAHWLGTSSLGHDVFSMFGYAAGPSLVVGLSAGLAIMAISLLLGSFAAHRRGWFDGFVSHLSDAMILLPAMLAVFVLGIGRPNDEFGSLQVGLSFGVIYALGPATATVRAAAMTVVARPFLDAARMAGGGGGWIVTRHVLPHLYSHAAVQAMIGATGAIIAAGFLSFRSAVGDDVGFGMMVYDGITWSDLLAGIAAIPWWIMLAGTAGITLMGAAFYLVGVGVREVLDPRSGELER